MCDRADRRRPQAHDDIKIWPIEATFSAHVHYL